MAIEAIHLKEKDLKILKPILAQQLYKNNVDQNKISKLLNLSQPTVSNYLKETRQIPNDLEPTVQNIIKQLLADKKIHISSIITYQSVPTDEFYLAKPHELNTANRSAIITHLNQAYSLLKNVNLSPLNPAVKINLAESIANAKDKNDVASFQSGLILTNQTIINHNGISFGTSNHLSELLIKIQKNYPQIKAIMNLANPQPLKKTQQFVLAHLTEEYQLNESENPPDLLLHPGSFGIEPCAYLLGTNAREVAEKLKILLEEMKS